jgi:transcriptional regulator with XRE-family HTH domain
MKHRRTFAARAFGRTLFHARKAAGLSQEKLAELGDFDRTYPSLLERGLRTPTFVVIVDLAEAMKIDPVKLFSTAVCELRDFEFCSGALGQNQVGEVPQGIGRPMRCCKFDMPAGNSKTQCSKGVSDLPPEIEKFEPEAGNSCRKVSRDALWRLASNVKRLRESLGYTQETLADVSGINKNYISNVEEGIVNVTLASLEALAAGLRCDLAELFRMISGGSAPTV